MFIQYFIVIIGIKLVTADCDACIEGICFNKTLLWSRANQPTQLIPGQFAIDRTTNTLFISTTTDDEEDRTVAISIDTGDYEIVPSILRYCRARTINQETRDYYYYCIASQLYKYNPISNTTEELGLNYVTVNEIRYSNDNKLYYSKLLRGLCYYVNATLSMCYRDLEYTEVDDFAIDKHDDLYFRSNARHYRLRNNTNEFTYIFTHRFIKLHLDRDNNLYFSLFDKIMKWDYERDDMVDVGVVKNANIYEGFFDRDNNLVYYDISGRGEIYKLSPDGGNCTI